LVGKNASTSDRAQLLEVVGREAGVESEGIGTKKDFILRSQF
jgi:hypothetical protein